ncbi:MFS transporter [Pseudonocardia sp. CA-107938]|uniref:MFS transporter n=1 Tax=Pseudonocardia sp. CA-107938 TaxID=3240021 RepID=UPI003D913A48
MALVVDAAGNGLFAPLSLIYFTRLTDVSLALVGTLLTVANLVALPLPIWAGAWADRIGPRPLVVASEAMMAAGFLAYAAVAGPVGILLSATLVAAGVRVFWCTIFTLLADYADGDDRPQARTTDGWYAVANMARTAGIAIGGLVTGVVAADGSTTAYRGVAIGAAVALAAAAVLVGVWVRTPRHAAAAETEPLGYRDLLRDHPYLELIGINTVWAGTSMMFALALPTVVLTTGAPPWLTAALLAANAILIATLSAPLVARLAGIRRTTVLAGAAALWALWCALLAVVGVVGAVVATVVLIASTLLFTVAETAHAPVSTGVAAAAAPPSARGRYMSTFQYSFAIASVIAPAFFATLYEAGPAWPFVVLGAINAVSVLGALRLARTLPPVAVAGPLPRV